MLFKAGSGGLPLQAWHSTAPHPPNQGILKSEPWTVEDRKEEGRKQGFGKTTGGVSLTIIVQIIVTFICSTNMHQAPSMCQE